MNKSDKPLCYCFNIFRTDVDEFFADGTKSYDDFVEKTRIGTKCTACLLDFDVHLDTVLKKRKALKNQRSVSSDRKTHRLKTFKTFTESGFCLPNTVAKTLISLQNYDQCFEGQNAAIDFKYHLMVFSECGELVDSNKGVLGRNSGVVLEPSLKLECEKPGWFILKLRGLIDGYFGTMRPQVLFNANGWAASYHTQPHSMASCRGHRSGVAVKINKRGSTAAFHVINASRKKNAITIQLLKHSNSQPVSCFNATMNGSAGVIYSLNDILDELPEPGIYNVLVNSRHPTRKHIINTLSDGSLSVDHFPN